MSFHRANARVPSTGTPSLATRGRLLSAPARMRRKASLLLTLTAWLFATGSQWDAVQAFAWARMFTTYAQSMPLLEAAKKTFSGEELCGLCEVVQDTRQGAQDESKASAPAEGKALGKMPLASPSETLFVLRLPPSVLCPPPSVFAPEAPRASPPTPPPRAAV